MKIEDAKKKLCPFAMETYQQKMDGSSCVATECMAWIPKIEFSEGFKRETTEGHCGRFGEVGK